MAFKSIIFVHGFGLRSSFWGLLPDELSKIAKVVTPDFNYSSIAEGVQILKNLVTTETEKHSGPCVLVGHSLGGIIAGLAARDLDPQIASHVIVIASPYGERKKTPGSSLVSFLLRNRLLPGSLIRSRFFGPSTPVELQKKVFSQATPENTLLLKEVSNHRWLHTGSFVSPLRQKSLCIASKADKIVPWQETEQYAKAIGARFQCYSKEFGIGHDDFTILPKFSSQVAQDIIQHLNHSQEQD